MTMPNLDETARQLEFVRGTTFRKIFNLVDVGVTLTEKDIALVFTAAKEKYSAPPAPDAIADMLPTAACKEHFKKLQEMETSDGPFFERFALFTKLDNDGLLLGIGADEMYYVVAVWDKNGSDVWQPMSNIFGEPVIA